MHLQAQAQAQTQAQTSEQTANTVKALIAGVSSLASVVKTALAPAGAAPAAPIPAAQQTVRPSLLRCQCSAEARCKTVKEVSRLVRVSHGVLWASSQRS